MRASILIAATAATASMAALAASPCLALTVVSSNMVSARASLVDPDARLEAAGAAYLNGSSPSNAAPVANIATYAMPAITYNLDGTPNGPKAKPARQGLFAKKDTAVAQPLSDAAAATVNAMMFPNGR